MTTLLSSATIRLGVGFWRTIGAASAVVIGLVALLVSIERLFGPGDLVAPAPAPVPGAEWVPRLPVSTLNVPVTYDLTPIIERLERLVPRSSGSLTERLPVEGNDRLTVAFALSRGRFRAALERDVARVSTIVTYRGRGWYDAPLLPEVGASCGMEDDNERPPRARLTLSARLSLTDDWELRGKPRLDAVVPVTDEERDRCRVSILDIDVTDKVLDAAAGLVRDHLPEIESAIAGIDLRSRFERWWRILQQPIGLTDDVWLVIDPTAVRRGPARSREQTLVTSLSLSARPRIVMGPRPSPTFVPLPTLDSAAVDEGLWVHASGTADFEAISERLTEHLAGETIEREGYVLRVRRLRMQGLGDGRVSVELDFDGSASGRLYLVGRPELDRSTGQVHVPDLEFDVATSSLLVSGYAWLREQGVKDFLRERARWPVEDIADLARTQLSQGLNRYLNEDVRLRGTVQSVDILGVYARRDELVVHAQARAEAEMIIVEADSTSRASSP